MPWRKLDTRVFRTAASAIAENLPGGLIADESDFGRVAFHPGSNSDEASLAASKFHQAKVVATPAWVVDGDFWSVCLCFPGWRQPA